jgi:hypothetical protein
VMGESIGHGNPPEWLTGSLMAPARIEPIIATNSCWQTSGDSRPVVLAVTFRRRPET